MVFISLQRHCTAIAGVGARRGGRQESRVTTTRVAKNKVELEEAKGGLARADPFAEFSSILGEDEESEAAYDPLRQGPLR